MAENNPIHLSAVTVDRGPMIAKKIERQGTATLLSKTYLSSGTAKDNFYTGESYGQEIGSEIPIVFGQVLLTGKILDEGAVRYDLDPDRIQKIYRFSNGEGPVKGIEGIGAEKLQNILINKEAVIDKETGKANKHGFGLKEIAMIGGGVGLLAAPWIYQLFDDDPVTGELIGTVKKALPGISDLINFSGDSFSDGQIVSLDPVTGELKNLDLSALLQDSIELQAMCAEAICEKCHETDGETDGETDEGTDTGTASVASVASTASVMTTLVTPNVVSASVAQPALDYNCNPIAPFSFSETSTYAAPPKRQFEPLKLLPHTGDNKVYSENIDLSSPGRFRLHYHLNGHYLTQTKTRTMVVEDPSFEGTRAPETITCRINGTVSLVWCVVQNGTLVKSGIMQVTDKYTDYSVSLSGEFHWEGLPVASDPCNPNRVRDPLSGAAATGELRIYRADNYNSSCDIYFQGFSFIPDEPVAPPVFEPKPLPTIPSLPPLECPPPLNTIADDEIYPMYNASGTYIAKGCYADVNLPPPVTPEDPDPETPEEPEGPDNPDPIDPPPTDPCTPVAKLVFKGATLNPSIVGMEPRNKTYSAGSIAPINLPVFSASTQQADTDVSVTFTLQQGTGFLMTSVVAPPASYEWQGVAKKLIVSGPVANVNQMIAAIQYFPGNNESADILYTASVIDSANKSASARGVFKILNGNITRDAVGATTTVTLGGTTGAIGLFANQKPISAMVTWKGNLALTAQALVSSVNTVSTTPNFTAEYVSGSTIKLVAPAALGYDANGWLISAETEGDLTLSGGGILDGGVSGVKNDNSPSLLSSLGKYALNLLPAVGAGLIANSIYNSLSTTEMAVPAELVDDDTIISVLLNGLIMDVPVAYDPSTGSHGTWDYSSFKQEYTTSPAWALWCFITNRRFGCGNSIRLTPAQRTRLLQDLYECSKRCDQTVPTGRGTDTERRYTINTAIAGMTRLEVLDAIAGVMHAQVIFSADGVRVMQDRPSVPVMVVNNSTVTGGIFNFSGGSMDSNYNFIDISWNQPAKYFQQDTVFVADPVDILARGYEVKHSVAAFGCTSEGQARRHGAWIITTEKTNPSIVSYTAGQDHSQLIPGDLVYLLNNEDEISLGSNQYGGRIIRKISDSQYVLSRGPGDGTFYIMNDDGVVVSVAGTTAKVGKDVILTLAGPYGFSPGAAFNCLAGAGEDNQYKVLSITENSNGTFSVSCIKSDPNKYTALDALALT